MQSLHDIVAARPRTSLGACAIALVFAVAVLAQCGGAQRVEGLDPQTLPASIRDDYEVFATRCSRCHSLSRPLNSGFARMDQWRNYVTRMRRQPGSGISPSDEPHILAFLYYYDSRRQAARNAGAMR